MEEVRYNINRKEEYLKYLEQIKLNYDAEYVNECSDEFCLAMRGYIKKIEELINDYFDYNSMEFKNFKLYADSTLKNMTKDDLISYIHTIYHNWQCADKSKQRLHNIIDDLTENNPLNFEELSKDEPIWDNKCGCWRFIISKDNSLKSVYDLIANEWIDFKENRFYWKEV